MKGFSTLASFGALASSLLSQVSAIKVMTYNVYNFDDGADWDNRKNYIFDNIAEYDPDFIAFQEVRRATCLFFCSGDQFSDLADFLDARGYLGYYRPVHQHSSSEEGLAFFSKYAWSSGNIQSQDISSGDSSDGNTRAIVNVAIDVPGVGVVNFFQSHWSYEGTERGYNGQRSAEFITSIRNSQSGTFRYMLMGDLNSGVTNPGAIVSLTDLRQTTMEATYCNCKLDGSACSLGSHLDHILIGPGASFTESGTIVHDSEPGVCPSDHRPFYATVNF